MCYRPRNPRPGFNIEVRQQGICIRLKNITTEVMLCGWSLRALWEGILSFKHPPNEPLNSSSSQTLIMTCFTLRTPFLLSLSVSHPPSPDFTSFRTNIWEARSYICRLTTPKPACTHLIDLSNSRLEDVSLWVLLVFSRCVVAFSLHSFIWCNDSACKSVVLYLTDVGSRLWSQSF